MIDKIVFADGFSEDPLFYTLLLMIDYSSPRDEWISIKEESYIIGGILIYMAKDVHLS